jgi:hypothetical protein
MYPRHIIPAEDQPFHKQVLYNTVLIDKVIKDQGAGGLRTAVEFGKIVIR